MKNLSTAIYGVFNALDDSGAHNDFYIDVQGQLFKGRAPEGAEYPYAVFMIVSDVPTRTWSENFEDAIVQFSLFSSASGSTQVEDMYTHLKDLFDESTFAVTANDLIWFRRVAASLISEDHTTPQGTVQVWHYAVDFEVKMQAETYNEGDDITWITGIVWDDGYA